MIEPPEIAAREQRRRWSWPATIAMWSPVLIVLYVLSIGPAYWMFVRGHISEKTWFSLGITFYVPLDWAMNTFPSFGKLIDEYLGWWM